jgi:mono/diheme cytochrome c family protein
MASFGQTLTDEQVAAVVGSIRTRIGNDLADAVTQADVAAER